MAEVEGSIFVMYTTFPWFIRESVDSLCRDGANAQYMQYLSKSRITSPQIVRLDRNRHGGGVAMFVNNSLSIKVLLHGPMGLELIVVSLFSHNHLNCCVVVFLQATIISIAYF